MRTTNRVDYVEWTDLAGASRATVVRESTIVQWIRRDMTSDEAYQLDGVARGAGKPWCINMAALRRVARSHGRFAWYPELARPSSHDVVKMAERVEQLEDQVRRLRARLAELEA
jgi:hypothetical protein